MNALQFGRMVKQALPAENPLGAAPAAAPKPPAASAPLPSGSVNYSHPQQKAFQSFYNGTVNRPLLDGGAHTPPPLTSTRSQGHVPYPIRGAGRMGSIPALSPADASAAVRAAK